MIKFPIIIKKDIGLDNYNKWQKYYNRKEDDHECFKEEGLWRRSQCIINKKHSNWLNQNDKRRRIVHYEHEFGVSKKENLFNFILKKTYIWISLCLPAEEIDEYYFNIIKNLENNKFWIKDCAKKDLYICGDLFLSIKRKKKIKEDIEQKRFFPEDYGILEINFYSKNNYKDEKFIAKPWLVLKNGVRKKDIRGNPFITNDPSVILKYLPAQIELGGGASIEAGIYPLHFLHEIYSVCDKEKNFIFNYKKDNIVRKIVTNPIKLIDKISLMHKKIINTSPNRFYKILKFLYDKNFIVGPIITNNFDGLIRQVGLNELYVRRYSDNIFPNVDFHKDAKSLIVVGSHADRRRIQKNAREKGLKVIYIDPEGYWNKKGFFVPYPLESPQDNDIIIKSKAGNVFCMLKKIIGN